MTTIKIYCNKRNHNKYIEVRNDGHYHNSVRQYMEWKDENGKQTEGLLDLIRAVHGVEGIKRIRLGSLEPRIVTEEFAKELACLPKICPHFHLSLQSGCDATLKRMNRRYDAAEYREKYSLQNAVKYEYFYDKWVPMADVLDLIPLKVPEVEDYVNKNRHIELKDTAFYYFLNVSDFRSVGEQEPYEFARPKVKDMMLNLKQVEFMKKVKDDLYQQAVKKNEIKYN